MDVVQEQVAGWTLSGTAEPARFAASAPTGGAPVTPFLAEYRLGEERIDEGTEDAEDFFAALADEEFDEALEALVDEAEDEARRVAGEGGPVTDPRVVRHLERWSEPLRAEAQSLLDRVADEFDGVDLLDLSEEEVDTRLGALAVGPDGGPAIEGFLRKLIKKAGSVVKGAVKVAKKGLSIASKLIPIGPLLRKLGQLVRPLLKRVVTMAIDKLPPALRPVAAGLATRFLGETTEGPGAAAPAAPDVRLFQAELDAGITALLFAPDVAVEDEVLSTADSAGAAESDVLEELDEARARFVRGLQELEEGADTAPLVEEFIPALLPALKIGLKIIGRPKVVAFLAKFLGRLISPLVGPAITPALSQAIVDVGLRLLTLETSDAQAEASPRVVAEAFADVVEDAVRRVAELSDDELDDETAVEAAAYEGFQEGVAASFPDPVLRGAAELTETSGPGGVWLSMPRGRPVRYRKYSRVYPVTITPQIARAVRVAGGGTLWSVLSPQLRAGRPLTGRLHLYQAVPGTRVSRIVRAERRSGAARVPLGRGLVQPLTREAAGMLAGEPGLGRDGAEHEGARLDPLPVGERLYALELDEAPGGGRRPSGATLAVDLARRELRIAVHLGEDDAQLLAARLRRGTTPPGVLVAVLRRIYLPALRAAVAGPRGRVRVTGGRSGGRRDADHMVRAARGPSRVIVSALQRWVGRTLGTGLVRRSEEFVTAAASPRDGVTLLVRIADPPGLAIVAGLLAGRGGGLEDVRSAADLVRRLAGQPQARLDITPGHHRA